MTIIRRHYRTPGIGVQPIRALLCLCLLWLAGCPAKAPDPLTQANDLSRQKRLEAQYAATPQDVVVAIELADAYETSQEYAKAEAIYTDLLKSGTEAVQGVAMNALAQLLARQGKPVEAFAWLWRSTDIGDSATKSQAWFLIGQLVVEVQSVPPEVQTGMADPAPSPAAAARWAFQQAIGTGVTDAEVYKALALLEESEGNLEDALAQYQSYLAANAGDMEGWLEAARLASMLKQTDLALFYLQLVQSRGSQAQRETAAQRISALTQAGDTGAESAAN